MRLRRLDESLELHARELQSKTQQTRWTKYVTSAPNARRTMNLTTHRICSAVIGNQSFTPALCWRRSPKLHATSVRSGSSGTKEMPHTKATATTGKRPILQFCLPNQRVHLPPTSERRKALTDRIAPLANRLHPQ